jgi:hypothetical protein
MNRFGYSSRLGYDKDCAYEDQLAESTGPLQYTLDTNRIYSCDGCLSTLGPRSGVGGYGVSTPVNNRPALSQAPELVNIESILSNRNVYKSRCKKDGANPIDVTKFPVKHARVCNDYLNPMASKLSYPPANYRDVGINRFYNLRKNPQNLGTIYFDIATNTRLEATDNFFDEIPEQWDVNKSLPKSLNGRQRKNAITIQQPLYPPA